MTWKSSLPLLVIVAIFTFSNTAHAATYYVSNSSANGWAIGNDVNGGTSTSSPKLSVAGALAVVASGDTVIVNDGSYAVNSVNLTKGITLNPLNASATTLTATSSYVFSVGVTDGSTLNIGSFIMDGAGVASYGVVIQNATTLFSTVFTSTQIQNFTRRGIDVRAKKLNLTTNNIVINNPAAAGTYGAIEFGNGSTVPFEQGTVAINGGTLTTNSVGTELNPAVFIFGTTTPNSIQVTVAGTAITVGAGTSANNYAAVQIKNISNVIIQNNTITATENSAGGLAPIYVLDSPTTSITGNTVTVNNLAGQNGFAIDGIHLLSTGTLMPNAVVANNTLNLNFTGTTSPGSHGILVGEDSSATSSVMFQKLNNSLIYGNTVIGNATNALYEHGIMIGNQSGGEVYNNKVDFSLHGFIAKGTTGSFFHNNIALHSLGEALRAKAAINTKFYNNVGVLVSGYASYGILVNEDSSVGLYSSGDDFKNNIIYSQVNPTNALVQVNTGNTATFSNNGYYSLGTTPFSYQGTAYGTAAAWGSAHESGLVYADPLFTSIPTNLTLQASSPMINAGTTTTITSDYVGNPIQGAPDIGAYEYQGAVISSIASSTTQTTATITWTTNQNTSSTVNYGATSAYGTASTSATLVTNHSITLSGLTAATLYHFNVGGSNASNTPATSSDQTFTTAVVPFGIPPRHSHKWTPRSLCA
ncbi:MAG: choice-of-anchor Q domain-containing protein [Candidatus Paceibacterota bacterium]